MRVWKKCPKCMVNLDNCGSGIWVCPKCNSEFWTDLMEKTLRLLKKGTQNLKDYRDRAGRVKSK